MRTLTVTNWTRWQSYRQDRGQPPWIKVHRTVLRNPEWTMLTDAQRGQLVQIWILAADKGGVIEVPDSVNMLTFIRRVCCMESEPSLEVLESLGFISFDANVTPSRRQRDANVTPQRRVEKSREETEKRQTPQAAPLGARSAHNSHAACGRVCVPSFLHSEFERLAPKDFDIRAWYGTVLDTWQDNGEAIGDDAPTFWRSRWREEHGTTKPSREELIEIENEKSGKRWLARKASE